MLHPKIPPICVPCIKRHQAQCPHLHTSFSGGWHFSEGEPWDDITEICDDCGANLHELTLAALSDCEKEEINN